MRRMLAMTLRIRLPATQLAMWPIRILPGVFLASFRLVGLLLGVLAAILAAVLGRLMLIGATERVRLRYGLWVFHQSLRLMRRIFGIQIERVGPRPTLGTLVVANHHSYLDIVALGSLSPCFFLAKVEISDWPLVGLAARLLGIPFVDRENGLSRFLAIVEIQRRLSLGCSVVNFPEGTTSSQSIPLPFKRGLFAKLAGTQTWIIPARIRCAEGVEAWVGDDTFLDHVFRLAMRPRTQLQITYSAPIHALDFSDSEELRDLCYDRVCVPEVPGTGDLEERMSFLRKPLIKRAIFTSRDRDTKIQVYDQPGRWMTSGELGGLWLDMLQVAAVAMDEIPIYGIFTGQRDAFANRVIAIARDARTLEPLAFAAMVYLPIQDDHGKVEPIVHLGLTMIKREARGRRLQTQLFKKIFILPVVNQLRLRFTVTNIAASPAGIGATSDYFQDVFPTYRGDTTREPFHLRIARKVLSEHRHEFGCSAKARFDPESFVVRGSNQNDGGGASQFIKEDPVSRYRIERCNAFCRQRLDYPAGDELFQVGRVDFFRSNWASRNSKRTLETTPAHSATLTANGHTR